ncbi:MAG: hypothetical protein AB8B56_00985 [Crocinitomicaceae bacterium]
MNHSQRLAVCESCKNKEFSPKMGVVCSLTSERPDFEGSCENYENDPKMVARAERAEESRKHLSDGGGGDFVEADGKNSSPWGVIITVIVVVLILLKWLIRCDRIMN